jgi:hypothetical protein
LVASHERENFAKQFTRQPIKFMPTATILSIFFLGHTWHDETARDGGSFAPVGRPPACQTQS